MSIKKAIDKLAGKQTALNDGTPVTILAPVMEYNYDSEAFRGKITVLNEETNEQQTVDIEDIAEDIKPRKLFGLF